MFTSKPSIFLPFAFILCSVLLGQGAAPVFPDERSLDGIWEIAFDPENIGRGETWHETEHFLGLDDRREITVPRAWERIEQDYEGVAFYHRSFEVPAEWAGKVVRLTFEAVNYIAEVYVNDEPVGRHEGGFTPFALRIDRVLKPCESNHISLRVQGPIILSDQEVDGIGPLETPQWRGGLTAGIWQSVKLVATDAVYVRDVFLQPSWSDHTVSLQAEFENTAPRGRAAEVLVEIREVTDPSVVVATTRESIDLRPGRNERSWTLKIPEARAWSPEDPFLYEAQVRILFDGTVSDAWGHRFGLREFTIRDGDFVFNGERLYLKATFFEGLYPNGIASPDSDAMIRREIQLAKDAGFNMIRPWRRPPVRRWLDLADEMGVLVVGTPVLECMGLPRSTPALPERVEREIRETLLRDRNCTCIVQWELFNELRLPILKQMMQRMALLTRELDPTRLILDESGGWAYGANMYLPGQYEPMQFNDIHHYAGPLINEERYDSFLSIGMTEEERTAFGFTGRTPGRNVVPGLMSFVSELGYGSLPNLPAVNARFQSDGNPLTPAFRYHARLEREQIAVLKACNFAHLFPSIEDFCLEQQDIHGEANKRMIEAVRSNPKVDGYCIHALCGGDWILGAGLIDIWREPKGHAYAATQAANEERILSIRMLPRNVYAERGATLSVTGINDLGAMDATLELEVVSAAGETVFRERLESDWTSGISTLLTRDLDTRNWEGTYIVKASVKGAAGQLVTENAFHFDVFPSAHLAIPAARIAVLDPAQELSPFLEHGGVPFVPFDASTALTMPVFVAGVKPEGDAMAETYASLFAFIEKGGTAVFVGAKRIEGVWRAPSQMRSGAIPVKGQVKGARGLWTGVPHLVRAHPIFEGLPVEQTMRELYGNVWAEDTLFGLDVEPIVATVAFDSYLDYHHKHYSGPGLSWWGSDLSIVPYGQGRCVISQLRLLDNLNRDPVADRLLFNLIRFVTPSNP